MSGLRVAVFRWCRFAAFLTFSLVATPAQGLTIEEALAEAVRFNLTLRAARENARAVHELVPQARAAWRPTIQFTMTGAANRSRTSLEAGSVSRSTAYEYLAPPPEQECLPFEQKFGHLCTGSTAVDVPNPDIGTTGNPLSAELSWIQNLYQGGQRSAALWQAEASVRQSHALVEDTEQAVLLQVATVYLDVLRAARAVDLREASLSFFRAHLRDTRAQFRVGDRTRADIAQAQAEHDVATADLAAARADLTIQRTLFETLVGVPPDGIQAAREPAGLPDSLDEAHRMAIEGRPAVRAAAHALRVAQAAVWAASGARRPRVDMRGALTWSRTASAPTAPFSDGYTSDASLGLQVVVPFYQGGADGARVQEARRRYAQRWEEWGAAMREAAQRATTAWLARSAARARHAAMEAAAAASTTALDAIRREAAVGERTTREVLDAERNLVARQVEALSAERDALVEAFRLMEAVGELTAQRLRVADAPDLESEARKTADGPEWSWRYFLNRWSGPGNTGER